MDGEPFPQEGISTLHWTYIWDVEESVSVGFGATALRVTRKEIGSYWLGSVVRRYVLKMALLHSLHPLSPEMSVGGEGMDHAEGFAGE